MNCAGCGAPLAGRQKKWCSPDCQKEAARAARLAARFNLTLNEYDLIAEHQGGVCAVCGKPPKAGARLVVDHSHKTGLVRGLLCHYCNLRVIAKHTDPRLLWRAAEYLAYPPAPEALGRDVVAPGRPRKRARKKRKPRERKKAA